MAYYREENFGRCAPTLRLICPPLTFTPFLYGYFDGANKDGICDHGYIIILATTMYHICWNGSNGKNIRDGILALWRIIFYACKFGLLQLEVFGDLQEVVEWVSNIYTFFLWLLFKWLGRIQKIMEHFTNMKITYTCKEFSSISNRLSKDGIFLPFGMLEYKFYTNSIYQHSGNFSIHQALVLVTTNHGMLG